MSISLCPWSCYYMEMVQNGRNERKWRKSEPAQKCIKLVGNFLLIMLHISWKFYQNISITILVIKSGDWGVGGSCPKFLETLFWHNGWPNSSARWANFLVGSRGPRPNKVGGFFMQASKTIKTIFLPKNLAKNWLTNFRGQNEKPTNLVIWEI